MAGAARSIADKVTEIAILVRMRAIKAQNRAESMAQLSRFLEQRQLQRTAAPDIAFSRPMADRFCRSTSRADPPQGPRRPSQEADIHAKA
jgi:hypothetical protein